MYLRKELDEIASLTKALTATVTAKAEEYADYILPGYTHLQRAQPILFGHHLMAYAMMLLRDLERLKDCRKRTNVSPIGCCALAGTTYETDRQMEAGLLGFEGIAMNSMDGVSDRDFAVEMLSTLAILMMHLSRLSEELILWASWEFRFISLSDAYTTGSSIMPQKRNADMAELIRGKTGRVYGELMGLLTTLKGLPLAYNKDMQEDKEPAFDAIDTALACIPLFADMLSTMKFNRDIMEKSAMRGFTNATDAADYLVGKGVPFRDAHGIIGRLVLHCIDAGKGIEELTLEELQKFSNQFEEDVFEAISLRACVNRRPTAGAPGEAAMAEEIAACRSWLQAQ
jgi:argininosuccinate lyase